MAKRLVVNIIFFSIIILALYAMVSGIAIVMNNAYSPITTNLK